MLKFSIPKRALEPHIGGLGNLPKYKIVESNKNAELSLTKTKKENGAVFSVEINTKYIC